MINNTPTMAAQMTLLGLDLGGTKCASLVGDERGNVIERVEWPTKHDSGPEAMMAEAITRSRELIGRHGQVDGAGVSIGGPLDVDGGVVLSPPNLPGWDQVPLRQRLTEALGMNVVVEHDAAACALAEHRWGVGRDASRVGFLTCGSGFGVGLIFDGEPYHGHGGRSIEIGHVRYREDGPIAFGKKGAFEAFGAGNSLPRLAAWLYPKRWGASPPCGEVLSEAANDGDADALHIIAVNAEAVGDACALLGDLLGLEVIALGSLGRYLGERWLTGVQQRFTEQVLPHVASTCRVELAALGERVQDCATLAVAARAAG